MIALTGSQLISASGVPVWFFDGTLNESHDASGKATEHPVSRQKSISDHISLNPFRLTITGVITNVPLSASADGIAPDPNRVRDTYRRLIQLWESRGLFTVVTGLEVYENMAIERVSVPRGQGGKLAIRPTVELKQIRLVTLAEVPIPESILADIANAKASAQSKQDKEQQSKSAADDATKLRWDENKTTAANLLDNTAAFFTRGTAGLVQ